MVTFKFKVSKLLGVFVAVLVVVVGIGILKPAWIAFMVQGLFVGLGVGVADYFKERHIKSGLSSIENNLRGLKNNVKDVVVDSVGGRIEEKT